ncbi:hypothetical protein CP532_6880 [Ophiocordyceps camponoti-leonardi (nom. inval.)]|nr:hypothetical protein CP532_6880 [Ophiocordyceps camponoti-leonardi (nom. inval.)]
MKPQSEKAAFFDLLKSLEADDDELDMREELDRRRRAAFFATKRDLSVRTGGEQTMVVATTDGGPDETVIPDSVVPAVKRMRRSDSTPLLLPAKRPFSNQSPSLEVGMRKRRRGGASSSSSTAAAAPKMRRTEEQIFRGLAFFYVPNNDIAPARRLRITRAREHGACWARDPSTATHIVVDRQLHYRDVGKVVSGEALARLPKVVNEEYPIDCIQFRSLLDDAQKKYRVPGAPVAEEAEDGQDELEVPASPVPDAGGGIELLPHNTSVVDATPQPTTTTTTTTRPLEAEAEDELARCVSMMQQYQHLPLDHEEDDDDEEGSDSDSSDKPKPKPGRKGGRFEDGFACNQAGQKDAAAENPNGRTIEVLQSMADYYERIDDHWRSSGYRKAIGTLRRHESKVRTAEEAVALPHIGWRIAQKIEEIVSTDRLRRLEYARDEPTDEALQLFLQIYGVGGRLARQWVAQGYRTLEDVSRGARLTPSQRVALEHYDDLQKRIPRQEVEALTRAVRATAEGIDPAVEFITGGSYRRGADSSGDVDLIVTKKGTNKAVELRPFLDELVDRLEEKGVVVARLSSSFSSTSSTSSSSTSSLTSRRKKESGGSIWHGCCRLTKDKDEDQDSTWRRLDLLLVPEAEMGGALLYFTGDDLFNRSMRLLAARKGMRLNQHGLFRGRRRGRRGGAEEWGALVEGRDERRIFEILGVRWREPWERWC